MERDIKFDIHELNIIYEDVKGLLEASHIGGYECKNCLECPLDHFEGIENPSEITIRQDIMNKILDDAAET